MIPLYNDPLSSPTRHHQVPPYFLSFSPLLPHWLLDSIQLISHAMTSHAIPSQAGVQYDPSTYLPTYLHLLTSPLPSPPKKNSKLPNPIMPAPSDGPDVPHVHQGIEHDGAVRDGLLSPDADGVRGRDGDPTLPDVRPVSDPDRVDHVYDGVRRHVYHHG